MKKSVFIFFLFFSIRFAFCQEFDAVSKLKNIQVQEIKGDRLVDINLLDQLRDKVVILEFWEYWCGPCIKSMPHLRSLKEKYPNDLIVLAVSADDLVDTRAIINEQPCPFTYLYDKGKAINAAFPHSGVPFTVLIDKKGNVAAYTYPTFVTDSLIEHLVGQKTILSTAEKKTYSNNHTNQTDSGTLVRFVLSKSGLNAHGPISVSETEEPAKILAGKDANEYKDTLVKRITYSTTSKNIMGLYHVAFPSVSRSRYFFTKDLAYIDSHDVVNMYSMHFSCSGLVGDAHRVYVQQLNAALGLTAEPVIKETRVLILKKMVLKDSTIKQCSNPDKMRYKSYGLGYNTFKIHDNAISVKNLASIIEDQVHIPVVTEIPELMKYDINLDLKFQSDNIEASIDLLNKSGILLERQIRKMEVIEIKKMPNTF
jgi:thiol-disulfide isomerase/thioredoxin